MLYRAGENNSRDKVNLHLSDMPRHNPFRIITERRANRRTTPRQRALFIETLHGRWHDAGYGSGQWHEDATDFAREVIACSARWFDSPGTRGQQQARTAVLQKLHQDTVSWLLPAAKGGRCRHVEDVTAAGMVFGVLLITYGTYCGKKRTCDFLWTKYLPHPVQERILRGSRFGGGMTEYFHWCLRTATSQADHEATLYAVVSRRHQKWYAGRVERWRHTTGRPDEPGPCVRLREHAEGMVDPKAPRLGSGAKYHLWKPYYPWAQVFIPLHGDTSDRVKKLEDYVICVDQPPANRRGKKMFYESTDWRLERSKDARARPPRWRRV